MPARAWLPEGAMRDGTIAHRLDRVVAEWTAKWIANGAAALTSDLGEAQGLERTAVQSGWLVVEDMLGVAACGDARLALASAMLGMPSVPRPLAAQDRPVLDRLAADALADLCRRLAASFDLPAATHVVPASRLPAGLAAEARTCTLAIAPAAPPILIVVASDLAVALRKSCVARVPADLVLRPLAEALGKQSVSLSARLGTASLNLSEFSQLAAGDVVLIDGDPSGDLDLLVERRAKCGSCALEESGGAYRLKIVQPLASAP